MSCCPHGRDTRPGWPCPPRCPPLGTGEEGKGHPWVALGGSRSLGGQGRVWMGRVWMRPCPPVPMLPPDEDSLSGDASDLKMPASQIKRKKRRHR